MHWEDNCSREKQYQLVIMANDGKCYCVGPLRNWEGIQNAVSEIKDLYEKHGISHHVGYREV